MSAALESIAALLPKLASSERQDLRHLLDEKDYVAWCADTAKFRGLIKGTAKIQRPASEVVDEMRR